MIDERKGKMATHDWCDLDSIIEKKRSDGDWAMSLANAYIANLEANDPAMLRRMNAIQQARRRNPYYDKLLSAYHESGHAVRFHVNGGSLLYITIGKGPKKSTVTDGEALAAFPRDYSSDPFRIASGALAGPLAEEIAPQECQVLRSCGDYIGDYDTVREAQNQYSSDPQMQSDFLDIVIQDVEEWVKIPHIAVMITALAKAVFTAITLDGKQATSIILDAFTAWKNSAEGEVQHLDIYHPPMPNWDAEIAHAMRRLRRLLA